MTSLTALRKASVALIIGAFALSACGGTTPTTGPTSAGAGSVAPTTAATTPPATSSLVTLPPSSDAPPATSGPAADPAVDLEIAAPYSLEPLDENVAAMFVSIMEQSIGNSAGAFDLGIRSVTKGGPQPVAIVVVMSFDDLPVGVEVLLDATAGAASGQGGTVDSRDIAGAPVRIIETQGQTVVFTVVGEDLLMVVAMNGEKKDNVDVTTAILEAN